MSLSEIERFEAKFIPEPNSGCWLWTACVRNANKYQQTWMHFRGRQQSAPRTAWTLYRGDIPTGMLVLHRCDNSYCVNPDHLYLGTTTDNVRDMVVRGRGRTKGQTTGPHNVREIFALKDTNQTLRQVAKKFGVSSTTIFRIWSGDRWSGFLQGRLA